MAGLSVGEAAMFGALGAFGAILLTYALPLGFAMAGGGAGPTITVGRVIGALIVLAATLALGGLAGTIAKGGEIKEAIAYGLAYQSTLVGLASNL